MSINRAEFSVEQNILYSTVSIFVIESSVNVSNTFKKDFNKILEKSKGGTKKELESKISKMFDRYKTGDKIEQNAETEASATANFARLEIVQQYNVPVKKENVSNDIDYNWNVWSGNHFVCSDDISREMIDFMTIAKASDTTLKN